MRWLLMFPCAAALLAQDTFVGAMGGVSTLSADARTAGSPPLSSSSYKPENGAAWQILAGRHFTDYFSLQASYSRNKNDIVLAGLDVSGGASFEQPMRATVGTLGFEAMAYFRARSQKLRPYLSAGPVGTWLEASVAGAQEIRGNPVLPPSRFSSSGAGFRVGVGIDLRVTPRFELRFTFSETIQGNAISRALTPAGQRNLANFQNLWGALYRF